MARSTENSKLRASPGLGYQAQSSENPGVMTLPKYTVKLNKREPVAEGTFAFCFDKPAGFAF
jgi:hypothetical protein